MSDRLKAGKNSQNQLKWQILTVVFLLIVMTVGLSVGSSPADWLTDDTRYAAEIKAAAERHGLDPQLVRSLIFQESRFRPGVRGKDGEVGLMQILPEGAAADYSRSNNRPEFSLRELYGVECNLEIGCWYLARAVRRWQGFAHGTELALAQYNAGERRAKKWQPAGTDGDVIRNITIKSTRNYVERIMKRYRRYKAAE